METVLIVSVAAASLGGACVGAMVGMYLGSQMMISAVKKAFGQDSDRD